MGNDEAVTPVFPNSDYCTGVCGSSGVLEALVRRAQDGGSYGVDVSTRVYQHAWINTDMVAGFTELLFAMACSHCRYIPRSGLERRLEQARIASVPSLPCNVLHDTRDVEHDQDKCE